MGTVKSNLYRYVYSSNNGWIIQKNKEHYGWYDKLEDALYERDRLESCNWDLGEWVYMRDTYNEYKDIPLPPHNLGLRSPRQYIRNKNGKWQIVKWLDNRQCCFGTYNTLEEAIKVRDNLIRNNWEME